ncbi:MAG: nitrate/nitrite transport system permease protein [Actinomycetota bacterium]|jgi:nitrate/nitrite transport system permease protein|nr:nitrate/nitrite transport system permease protein [Actinomycetota bacterium]
MTSIALERHPVAPPEPVAADRPPRLAWRAPAASIGWGLLGAAVTIALWQLVAMRAPALPTPAEGFGELARLLRSPFANHGPNDKGVGLQLVTSLGRVLSGFGLAAAVGIPVGLAIGASRRAWQAVNPVVQILRPVSPLAWFPIWLMVWKDAGHASISVILITALWPIVINTAAGAAAVPRDHRNVAKVFRFDRRTYLRHVLLPNALPSIVTGLRLSMGVAWMVIVAVEMLSGGSGIGFFVWDSYNASNLAAVVAAIVLIGGVGVVLDFAFLRLAKRVAIEEVVA